MKGEKIADQQTPIQRLAELATDPLTQLTELLAELNPRKGHEIKTGVNERHLLGATIVAWIQLGADDELADTAAHTDDMLVEKYRLLPNQAVRFTAYGNFPDREDMEYDIIYVLEPSGHFKTQPYAIIEVPSEPPPKDEV